MCVMAAGMALATGPTDSVLAALPESRAGVGSAVNDTTPELGGALGVAVVGSVMSWYYGAAGAGLDRARRRARNPAVRQNRARGRARSSRPGPCAGGDRSQLVYGRPACRLVHGRRRRPPGSAGRVLFLPQHDAPATAAVGDGPATGIPDRIAAASVAAPPFAAPIPSRARSERPQPGPAEIVRS